MSLNLMGLFQRPFMDWDGALPLSPLSSLSFIPFPMAHFMDLSPLSSQNRSIAATKCDFRRFPAPLHDNAEHEVRTTEQPPS